MFIVGENGREKERRGSLFGMDRVGLERRDEMVPGRILHVGGYLADGIMQPDRWSRCQVSDGSASRDEIWEIAMHHRFNMIPVPG